MTYEMYMNLYGVAIRMPLSNHRMSERERRSLFTT